MIRSITLGLLVALAAAGLGTFSLPVQAQDPASEQAKPGKRAQQERHLWWNDPAVIEKLALTADQRSEMDRIFDEFLSTGGAGLAHQARAAFHTALEPRSSVHARGPET
jgi:hypothetical protein